MRIFTSILLLCLFTNIGILATKKAVPIDKSTQQQTTYDVIVVGAGLTGLSAARLIQQTRPELSVLILEARGQVGGRIRYATMQTRNGVEFVDTGAQFISPNDDELIRLIGELKIEISQQLTCGNNTLYQQKQKRSVGEQEQWTATEFSDMILNEDVIGNLTTESVANYMSNLSTSDSDTVNRLLQTFFDAPGEQTSSVQLALTCSSQNATVSQILERFGHGQSFLAKGGMNEVVRRLADGLLIEYNQTVVTVNDAISPAIITTSSGINYSARQVILAVPIPTLSNINMIPTPEAPFEQLINNYGTTGHAYYFTMTFQRPTWRFNGKSGKVIYTSQSGPLVWLTTFDTTYAPTCNNATGAASTLWGIAHFSYEVPFETRKRLYTQAMTYSFRFADFSPIDITDVSFTNDEFAKGTIPTLRVNIPFESLRYLNDFHTIYQNVHVSTADLASVSLGTMNGAVHAGQMVAAYTLAMLTTADLTNNFENILRDQPVESTTPFNFQTTSHYPPQIFEAVNIIQAYSDQQQVASGTGTTSFNYETSSQYPTTSQSPTTTTMKHFSFGNLDNNSTVEEVASVAVIQYDQQGQNKEFVYSTSSVIPPVEPIETTTYIHFSNGNLGNNIQRDDASQSVQENTSNVSSTFEYATSTHYPISASTNANNATPSPQVVEELQNVSENAQNTTAIELAKTLTNIVHSILTGLRLQ